MKHFCMLLALSAVTTLWVANQANADPASSSATSSDPNFRWHNNQWWYWQAPQQRWMVWDGSQWQTHQPRAATRSFSYQQTPSAGTQSFRPRSSANSGRITGSFGHRDAGSKVRGNY